jgi:hypothetical protein
MDELDCMKSTFDQWTLFIDKAVDIISAVDLEELCSELGK